ncbi:MAG: fumarate hydratase [Capsulimonadales bacterium]|nr:fumarate hydratase [Capsulimonadales bacterium]
MLKQSLLELIRRTSSDLPADIRQALQAGREKEARGSRALLALDTIDCNIGTAAEESAPICQDTGMIKFYVHHPIGYDTLAFEEAAQEAVAEATAVGYLRQNSVDSLTGKNTGNNLGPGTPLFHFQAWRQPRTEVRLILKGGGCENVGAQYSLPAELPELGKKAGRDLEGCKLVILHAIWKAQGKGCSPGYIGVCIGGDRASGYETAKEQLLRVVGDTNPDPTLAALEDEITRIANGLGVGPMGWGGDTTLLGCKIAARNRLPASFFVSVAYACWAHRRRGVTLDPTTDRITGWLYESAEETLPETH